MFTGLIEEVGQISGITPFGKGRRITVRADKVLSDLTIDDSVALNGACQTVVARTSSTFTVEAVEETLLKTTLGSFRMGQPVNLERAARLGDRLGGHIVQGHIDCRGQVASIEEKADSWLLSVSFPVEYGKYVVPTGSICIDGVSLTTARIAAHGITVSIIPHTWKVTTLGALSVGSHVNIEFDVLGKYIERLLSFRNDNTVAQDEGLTEAKLAKFGFW